MAQTLDLHGELHGLVVRNTFLDFSDEGLGSEQPPTRRTRAVSDLTDTKLPWKVPLSQDSSLFQITRHRFSSDDRMTMEDSMLESVSEEALEHQMSQSAPSGVSLGRHPWGWPSGPGLGSCLGLGPGPGSPLLGFPGPGHPWWYGSAGVVAPPWAPFPIWGYPPAFPTELPQAEMPLAPALPARGAQKGSGKKDKNGGGPPHSQQGPMFQEKGSRGSQGKGVSRQPEVQGGGKSAGFSSQAPAFDSKDSIAMRADTTPATMTTIMLRNIPNKYSSDLLVQLLDERGFKAQYDFVYLPMDFQNKVNLGYAFVNLLTNAEAVRFRDIFQGFCGWKFESVKESDISWAHPHQGLAEHIDRYRNSPVMHPSMPEEYKPLIFQGGVRVPFPAPTRPIKAPKLRLNKERQGMSG